MPDKKRERYKRAIKDNPDLPPKCVKQLIDALEDELDELLAPFVPEGISDNVNNPSHYQLPNGRESIDIIQDILSAEEFKGFLRGNILKYQIRYKQKNGVEDLQKAGWYMDKLIEIEEKV